MVKLENNTRQYKIGILGGTFDPPHKGHLAISKEALKRFNFKNVTWVITKQNPLKKVSKYSLKKRITLCKKVIGKNKKIKIEYYENKIKSNKTIDLINHLLKNKKINLYFLMGADNLINFHKWNKSNIIIKKCKIIIFDRHGYKKKSLNSKTYKNFKNDKTFTFVKFNKVNISSSQLRKI